MRLDWRLRGRRFLRVPLIWAPSGASTGGGASVRPDDGKPTVKSARQTRHRGDERVEIRRYRPSDCKELMELFYNTVHTVNAKDYTKEQLDAWTAQMDPSKWDRRLQQHYSVVSVENGRILGFGDMDETGYLDHLFVRADHQGKGVATAICDHLERAVRGKIVTHASITARPFFEKRGYRVVREQRVERQGVLLSNFVMEKEQ